MSLRRFTYVGMLGFACACGAETDDPLDAGSGDVYLLRPPEGGTAKPDSGARLTPHDGYILPNMKLGVVYLGDVDAGGAPNDDVDIAWLLKSPYWDVLSEYGIGNGAVAGSLRVPTNVVLQPSDVSSSGLVEQFVLQLRVAAALGTDGGAPKISIPGAEAYAFFLPDGVNVALGHAGSYTYTTCIDAWGYHTHDGVEPYAVFPPCPKGRSLYAISHELTEMATDPQPFLGWATDPDTPSGEVADLCETEVMLMGVVLTRLWSNVAAACIP